MKIGSTAYSEPHYLWHQLFIKCNKNDENTSAILTGSTQKSKTLNKASQRKGYQQLPLVNNEFNFRFLIEITGA